MAFTDWEVTKSHAGIAVALTTTGPLAGSSSLRLDNQAIAESANGAVHLRLGSAWPRGFTAGRVRTLLKATSNWEFYAATGYAGLCGVLCLMSASDCLAAGGKAYVGGLYNANTPEWRIGKATNGLYNAGFASYVASGTTTLAPTAVNTLRAIELEWRADSVALGGTRLILRVGTLADFTDLQTIYDVIDTSSPLLTSVGEGLCDVDTAGLSSSGRREWLFDSTTIVQLA